MRESHVTQNRPLTVVVQVFVAATCSHISGEVASSAAAGDTLILHAEM